MLRAAVLIVALVAAASAGPRVTYRNMHDQRIVNGTDAPAGKYPGQISLRNRGSHSCGGSIINENWVLTAAHCVYGDSPSVHSVLSGTTTLNSGGVTSQVTDIVWHENYNSFTIENDVALVRVATPFVFNDMTRPVALPTQGQDSPGGSDATVIGWGYPYTGGSVMNNLQEVDYWIVSDQECMDAHNFEVFPTNICAYYPGGGKGQCSGDSGGPLFVGRQQVGIVSWSEKPCTVAPYPGVFTQVSAFRDWIETNMY